MASKRLVDEILSDDSTEENGQREVFSRHATESLYVSDDQEMFALGPSVSNRRRIELESDLPEEHENESEDDNNRNTVHVNFQ